MDSEILIQPPLAKAGQTLAFHLAALGLDTDYKRISVAVAYSTVAGITRLRDLVEAASPNLRYRWLLGLDDYITQPGAIRECQSLPNSEVRIFKSRKSGSRFHPKLYMFEPRQADGNLISIIGSSNLTNAALQRNCEANTLLRASHEADRRKLQRRFGGLWKIDKAPTHKLIESYEFEYNRRRPLRRKLESLASKLETRQTKAQLILGTDDAEIGPASATTCWIEVGKATAQGRELEFKAEQAAFFGLKPAGEVAKYFDFIASNGAKVQMRMKYQGNHMWRLQLISEVPEVAVGLRRMYGGKLARSPYMAVFQRTDQKNVYTITFPKARSEEANQLKAKSTQMGTIGQTSSRSYGWV